MGGTLGEEVEQGRGLGGPVTRNSKGGNPTHGCLNARKKWAWSHFLSSAGGETHSEQLHVRGDRVESKEGGTEGEGRVTDETRWDSQHMQRWGGEKSEARSFVLGVILSSFQLH